MSNTIFVEDHAVGLATFTIMAGLGGSLGYAMGGIDWGALGEWNQQAARTENILEDTRYYAQAHSSGVM